MQNAANYFARCRDWNIWFSLTEMSFTETLQTLSLYPLLVNKWKSSGCVPCMGKRLGSLFRCCWVSLAGYLGALTDPRALVLVIWGQVFLVKEEFIARLLCSGNLTDLSFVESGFPSLISLPCFFMKQSSASWEQRPAHGTVDAAPQRCDSVSGAQPLMSIGPSSPHPIHSLPSSST